VVEPGMGSIEALVLGLKDTGQWFGKVVARSAPPGCDRAFLIRDIEVEGTIRRITAVEQLPAGPVGPGDEENLMPQSSASGSST
jgi:hypothetical protein